MSEAGCIAALLDTTNASQPRLSNVKGMKREERSNEKSKKTGGTVEKKEGRKVKENGKNCKSIRKSLFGLFVHPICFPFGSILPFLLADFCSLISFRIC